ncbi:hypothetical protein ElyMa_000450400 [Elysia marginata]|uniref:HAT C-terminal dimerisation domain-containing protein n=1 Tax=Elysia marginata TaxID=1093978 RepID=A0AAV4FPM2_9GAST|nr:hypothetical protein ElyMa_000450400 [Elysia marginata]
MRAKNQHLLDISGDTVHMVNNAAKKFFVGLDKDIFSVTEMASDVYYDIEDSPKARKLFGQIQSTLYGGLSEEIRDYISSEEVSLIDDDTEDKNFRIDASWWTPIFAMKRKGEPIYPLLSQLIKALFSIFSEPLVEGTFNIMGDFIERARLTSFNYEALAMTKSFLSARKLKATTMEIPTGMLRCVSNSYAVYNEFLKSNSNAPPENGPTCTSPNKNKEMSSASQSQPQDHSPQLTNSAPPVSAKKKQTSLMGFFAKKPNHS